MTMLNLYIGFDRDGTLELPEQPFNQALAIKLKTLQGNGAKLFLASGKGSDFLYNHFKQFDLHFDIICGENGGHIITNKLEHVVRDTQSHLDFYYENLESLGLPYYENEPKKSIWTGRFFDNSQIAAKIIKNFIETHKLNLYVYLHPDIVGAVDVVPYIIDKRNVLDFIPEGSEIHFFGDGENDLSLMRHERVIPHAVANAVSQVKYCVLEKNGEVSKLSSRDGVDGLIDYIFLGNKYYDAI